MAILNFPTPTLLRNIDDPSANQDAATKYYVDTQLATSSYSANAFTQAAFDEANSAYALASAASSNGAGFVLKTGDTITGIINITNTANAVDNMSGALVVSGGVGIQGNLYVTSVYANNYYGTIDCGAF
jgi:hypothetical protein